MAFVVMVDEHFHYTDPEERFWTGEIAQAEEFLARCRRIVDDRLSATLADTTR